MSCSPKEKSDSENFFEDGGRLSQSPVQFSGSLPVTRNEHLPYQPVNISVASPREVKADESRSSSSYSMEFEEEEPEGGIVEVICMFLNHCFFQLLLETKYYQFENREL